MKIQLTENQALILIRSAAQECKNYQTIIPDGAILQAWRNAGYIEKSAIEQAREIKLDYANWNGGNFYKADDVKKKLELYEKAIAELQSGE